MSNQFSCDEICKQMKVIPNINPQFEVERRISFIKSTLVHSGLTHLVLGISGGIDSTTCGKLAQLAVDQLNKEYFDPKYFFIAVRLPYGTQADEADAKKSLAFILPSKSILIDIKSSVDSIHKEIIASANIDTTYNKHNFKEDFAKGNTKARIRMTAQYEIAGLFNGLVIGTDHSAENITGFYTKWGDGACDLAPLFGLSKRQVRQIAAFLDAPLALINKTPTADLECLAPQKSDEHALGITYDEIDDFLEGKPVSATTINAIITVFQKTTHKRDSVPTIYD
tara:strand:+ start:128 stop:973 length:846 start_codon:yes stop_codon:yes gene_type:complete